MFIENPRYFRIIYVQLYQKTTAKTAEAPALAAVCARTDAA
jgi:hypothetical protein